MAKATATTSTANGLSESCGYVVLVGCARSTSGPIYIGWAPNTPRSMAILLRFLQIANPNELAVLSWARSTLNEATALLDDLGASRVGGMGSRWFKRDRAIRNLIAAFNRGGIEAEDVVHLARPNARRSAKPRSAKPKSPTKAGRPRAKTPAHAQGMAA